MFFPRGYMLLRGYVTPAHLYRSFAWLYTSSHGYIILRGYTTFSWLYGSLPCLFSSFECLYGFQWLYDFYMNPELEIN